MESAGPLVLRAYPRADPDTRPPAEGRTDVVHFLVSSAGLYRTYREIYDIQYYKGFAAGHGETGLSDQRSINH
jgi:hypothetical protein